VRVTFFAPSREEIHLFAKRVHYDNQSRILTAEGGVRVESQQGYRFSSQSVTYDAREKELQTHDKVNLEKDRLVIEGTGMEGSLTDQRFVLLSEVKAVFSPGNLP